MPFGHPASKAVSPPCCSPQMSLNAVVVWRVIRPILVLVAPGRVGRRLRLRCAPGGSLSSPSSGPKGASTPAIPGLEDASVSIAPTMRFKSHPPRIAGISREELGDRKGRSCPVRAIFLPGIKQKLPYRPSSPCTSTVSESTTAAIRRDESAVQHTKNHMLAPRAVPAKR